jgi:uncharacterized protein YndB with AHSA1/START domain
MASDPSDDVVELETWIAASPEAVFPFLTDPGRLMRWIGIAAVVEPTPGGVFRVDMNGRDVALGRYREVVPNRRVVFTWGWEGGAHGLPPGTTTVTIDLEAESGGTRLRLRHAGLRGDNRDRHARGWQHYTARLKTVAEGGEPGPDPLASPDIAHA